MEILRNILAVINIILAVVITILATIQTKDSDGASGTITGSSTSNFYEKNRGRTKEGMLKRLTIIFSVIYVLLTVALTILYVVVNNVG